MSMPIPKTLSAEAQAALAARLNVPTLPDPGPHDEAGWQMLGAIAASTDPGTIEALAMATTGAVVVDVPTTVERRVADQAVYYVAEPEATNPTDNRVLMYMHGGAFTFGGGESARRSTQMLGGCFNVRTYGMDYRQLPDHPYPSGLDDCMTVYRKLLGLYGPESIVVAGQSAGANLAVALLLRARDEGIPLPAAAGLISPPSDLTRAGDTYQTNGFTVEPGALFNALERYRGTSNLDDPYLSPLFGTFTPDFPPIILTAGTRDFLLSDTVRLHRKLLTAGVRAELHIWEGAPHGMFAGHAPEDREQIDQLRLFFNDAWAAASQR